MTMRKRFLVVPMMREKVARAIAAGLGYDFDNLYANKGAWTADRGAWHGIDTPYVSDMYAAADAVLTLIADTRAVVYDSTGDATTAENFEARLRYTAFTETGST